MVPYGSLDDRLASLVSLGDVPAGLVRLPFNLVYAGSLPSWVEAEPYDAGSYGGLRSRLLGSEPIEDARRLPVAMHAHAFATKRAMLEGRDGVSDVLSIAGGGVVLAGSRFAAPYGVFSLFPPHRSVYAVALSYDDGSAFFLPTSDGLDRVRSPNREVPHGLRRGFDVARMARPRTIGIERFGV